jgi:hypothetical protein
MLATALITRDTGKVVATKSRTFADTDLAHHYCGQWNDAATAQGRGAVSFEVHDLDVKTTFTEGATAMDKQWAHDLVTTCTAGKSTHSSAAGMCGIHR